jgi:hypothetical protein
VPDGNWPDGGTVTHRRRHRGDPRPPCRFCQSLLLSIVVADRKATSIAGYRLAGIRQADGCAVPVSARWWRCGGLCCARFGGGSLDHELLGDYDGRRVAMFEANDIREWLGHDVVDSGSKIGTLEAMYMDTATGGAVFATLTVGLPTRRRLVFVSLAPGRDDGRTRLSEGDICVGTGGVSLAHRHRRRVARQRRTSDIQAQRPQLPDRSRWRATPWASLTGSRRDSPVPAAL